VKTIYDFGGFILLIILAFKLFPFLTKDMSHKTSQLNLITTFQVIKITVGHFSVAEACECGNEPSGSVKCGEFLD